MKNIKEQLSLHSALSRQLDFLRAASAFLVLIGHVALILYEKEGGAIFDYLTGFGHQAVMIFFVISGFLVSRSAMICLTSGKGGLLRYVIDRSLRLYCVLFPALLLTWGLDSVITVLWPEVEKYKYLVNRAGFVNMVGNLAFLQTIYFPVFGSNGPLWSLAYEFWYYAVFPVMFSLYLYWRKPKAVVVLSMLLVSFFVFLPWPILKLFIVWLIGASVWAIKRPIIRSTFLSWIVFLAVFLASGLPFAQMQYVGFAFDLLIAVSLAGLIVSYRYSDDNKLKRDQCPIRFFSDFSYSLYLVHFPLLVFTGAIISWYGIKLSVSPVGIEIFIAIVGVVYLISYIFARLTELNTHKLKAFVHSRLL